MAEEVEPAAVLQPVTSEELAGAAAWRAVVDLDIATEARARAELEAAVARCHSDGHGWLVLDLAGVFVDVRGVAVLLDTRELALRAGSRLVIAAAPPSLRLIWEALQLDGAVPLLQSQMEAAMLIQSANHDDRP